MVQKFDEERVHMAHEFQMMLSQLQQNNPELVIPQGLTDFLLVNDRSRDDATSKIGIPRMHEPSSADAHDSSSLQVCMSYLSI